MNTIDCRVVCIVQLIGPQGEHVYESSAIPLAAIPLSPELSYHATLHPTLSLRRGAGSSEAAEATVSFAAPLQCALLAGRGFRPISQLLAAQRGGGRSMPMLGQAPYRASRRFCGRSEPPASVAAEGIGSGQTSGGEAAGGSEDASRAVESLLWEQLASLLGASAHLSSCTSIAWWRDMLPKAEPASLAAAECVICCGPLVDPRRPEQKPRPGFEPVGTACGHRFHAQCAPPALGPSPRSQPVAGPTFPPFAPRLTARPVHCPTPLRRPSPSYLGAAPLPSVHLRRHLQVARGG